MTSLHVFVSFSLTFSLHSAPILNGEVNHTTTSNGGSSLTSDMEGNGHAGKHSSDDEIAFNVNKILVDELIEIVRSPKIGNVLLRCVF